MKRLIDIHSHILPRVDDGCGSEKEAVEMLKLYEEQDVEAVICTPHFGPCGITGADVNGAYHRLATKSNVKLFLGNEIMFTEYIVEDIREGYARTLAGSNYILVEFDDWFYYATASEIFHGLLQLARSEFIPILAHPERYVNLRKNPHYYKLIVNAGVKLQVNAYDIVENENRDVRQASKYLLEHRMVSFIGSDAHGSKRRPPAVTHGVKWIYENLPEAYADAIVHDNAEKIIGGA